MREEMEYEYWFANIKHLSDKRKKEIRKCMKCAKEIYYIEETKLKQIVEKEEEVSAILNSIKTWKLKEEYEKLLRQEVSFFTCFDEEYPEELKQISFPPYAIYLKGKKMKKDVFRVAIVGARQCSPYGEIMAAEFAEVLAQNGAEIISGLARGVDSAGQRGALNVGGTSYGVLASGVDICYPRENIGLYTDLQERGGLISEKPLGMHPLPQYFPARNRIISGLCDVVLVMEAKERSGSLITADQALEQGKEVYALPGPVNSELSKGCNQLIKQGAGILITPLELIEELKISGTVKMKNKLKKQIKLESAENIVYSCLGLYPKNVNQLIEETNMKLSELMNHLVSLEIKGHIREISKNYYVKNKK